MYVTSVFFLASHLATFLFRMPLLLVSSVALIFPVLEFSVIQHL